MPSNAPQESSSSRDVETHDDHQSSSVLISEAKEAPDNEHRFIHLLYESFLGRSPSSQDVAHHVELLKTMTPLALVLSLADSGEARDLREARFQRYEPGAMPPRPVEPLAIRADDVLQVIGQALSLGMDVRPTLDQVMLLFRRFARGEELATVLRPHLSATAGGSGAETPESVAATMHVLYRRVLRRAPSGDEIAYWQNTFLSLGRLSSVVSIVDTSEEARKLDQATSIDMPAGLFVQMAFEIILGRGASAHEVDLYRSRMERDGLQAGDLVNSFFNDRLQHRLAGTKAANDPNSAYLFGSRGIVASTEWDRGVAKAAPQDDRRALGDGSLFSFDRRECCAVSIITSLYRGGRYIEHFLENITSQTIFRDHCELIIIDADSPDGEGEIIARFQTEFPNIVYRRQNSRVGIYEAWNIAIRMAKGRYITNCNLDDTRRRDSLEIQAAILDTLPFASVTYQDVLYSFEPGIAFEEVERHRLRTDLPIISRYNLIEFNSPHNAPMWRRRLHDEVGYFNEDYRSAADFEFWIRCHIAGVVFFKSNDAHVAYYVNPEGLSTRPDTRGVDEANAVSRTYFSQMISPLLILPAAQFVGSVDGARDAALDSRDRYGVVQAALQRLGKTSHPLTENVP